METNKQSNRTQTATNRSATQGIRVVGGLIYGVIAFVVAFVATIGFFIFRLSEINETGFQLARLFPEEHVEALGWVFYNAHTVDITVSTANGAMGETINYLEAIPQLNTMVFYAIPAVLLFLAGYVVASRVRDSLSGGAAMAAGASVAIGYVPLFVAGTFVLTIESFGATAGPQLGAPLLVAGTLFAVVCGGVGGLLGG